MHLNLSFCVGYGLIVLLNSDLFLVLDSLVVVVVALLLLLLLLDNNNNNNK